MVLNHAISISLFVIIIATLFYLYSESIDFSYLSFDDFVNIDLVITLLIAFVITWLLLIPVRVIKKYRGKDTKLNHTIITTFFAVVLLLELLLGAAECGDCTDRGRAAYAASIGIALKIPITVFYSDYERYPTIEEIVKSPEAVTSNNVEGVTIDQEGRIIVTMKKSMHKNISGKTIIFTPHNGGQTWDCLDGNLQNKYRLGACKKK